MYNAFIHNKQLRKRLKKTYMPVYEHHIIRANSKLIHTFAALAIFTTYQHEIVKKTGTNLFYINFLA